MAPAVPEVVVLCCLAAAACGTGASGGSPPSNAPISGAAGFNKVVGAYVIVDANADLTDPAVVAETARGPYHIWFTYGGTEIRRVDLLRLGTDPTPARPALAATLPWEGGRVAAPSVEPTPSGYQMVYEAADGLLGRADSADGETWTGKTMLRAGRAPALAGGRLFYEQGGQIWVDDTPVLTGTAPEVHQHAVSQGPPLWQLWFNCPGTDGVSVAICYAGSFDGLRFESTLVPILQPSAPSELGPATTVGEDFAVLFFSQKPTGLRARIGAATAP